MTILDQYKKAVDSGYDYCAGITESLRMVEVSNLQDDIPTLCGLSARAIEALYSDFSWHIYGLKWVSLDRYVAHFKDWLYSSTKNYDQESTNEKPAWFDFGEKKMNYLKEITSINQEIDKLHEKVRSYKKESKLETEFYKFYIDEDAALCIENKDVDTTLYLCEGEAKELYKYLKGIFE